MSTRTSKFLFISILTITCFSALEAKAKGNDPVNTISKDELDTPPDVSNANTLTTKVKTKKKPKEVSNWSLMIPTAVVHGFQPSTAATYDMPHKITDNGDAVWTPGVALEYVSPGGALVLGALVKDCYDHYAGTIQFGEDYRIDRDSHWAWSFGVYVRPTPLDCSTAGNYQGCTLEDSISQPFVNNIHGSLVDIIPLPFLHYNTVLYSDRHMEIRLKVLANFLLNEVGLEIPL